MRLSGGSDNGADGAGVLNGWSKAGTSPEFSIVTGVSTGALIAPLAFLGKDQDPTLERIYTTISARDIYRPKFAPTIPGSSSAASTKPLAGLIASVMTDALIDRIGREHSVGRRLFVGTANLDAQRMVVWNMGAIAASSAPVGYTLFVKCFSPPPLSGAVSPVMIRSKVARRAIEEMHVDGSTSAQILSLPDEMAAATAATSPCGSILS